MGSIIFVHGTGVRKDSYEETFKQVKKQLYKYAAGWELVECSWGEQCGVKLHLQGKSIPDYAGKATKSEQDEVMRWWTLYQDPLCEMRLLSAADASRGVVLPGKKPTWKLLHEQIEAFIPSAELWQMLADCGLEAVWDEAFREVVESPEYQKAVVKAGPYPGDFRERVARAVLAQSALLALARGTPSAGSENRNAIFNRMVGELGGKDMGARAVGQAIWGGLQAVGNIFLANVLTAGAYSGVLNRGSITDKSLPASGDVLLYQTRGRQIQQFIWNVITHSERKPPIYLLAHSLGGIACVDLLVEESRKGKEAINKINVAGLITAGSQVPLLYEMNCLKSLEGGMPLPEHFPRWLNFYDRNDLLSYLGEEVFSEKRVKDVEIVSHDPFPQAHSAYWSSTKLWKEIQEFIK